jgi:hypothetical protein
MRGDIRDRFPVPAFREWVIAWPAEFCLRSGSAVNPENPEFYSDSTDGKLRYFCERR